MIEFLVGVDGGGSGTRALLARLDGRVIGRGSSGPSALGNGVATAWREVERAVVLAFDAAGLSVAEWSACALGAGLAGVTYTPWRNAFMDANPGFEPLVVDTDGFAMLLGAHGGKAGLLVAAGTGTVGDVLRADGSRASVGGWGFPVGDEGGGAWLGLNAMRIAQAALDGRAPAGVLARSIWRRCGSVRGTLLDWCAVALPFDYAQLAPLVFEAESDDASAAHLLRQARDALVALALALDPAGELPVVVSGGVGRRLARALPGPLRVRCVPALAEADAGALQMIRDFMAVAVRGS